MSLLRLSGSMSSHLSSLATIVENDSRSKLAQTLAQLVAVWAKMGLTWQE